MRTVAGKPRGESANGDADRTPAAARNNARPSDVSRRVNPDRRAIVFTLLRSAGMIAVALFLILVLFPVALAAQSVHP